MSHGNQGLLFNGPKPAVGEAVAFTDLVQAVPIARLIFHVGHADEWEDWHRKAAAVGSAWRVLSHSEVKVGDDNHAKIIRGK